VSLQASSRKPDASTDVPLVKADYVTGSRDKPEETGGFTLQFSLATEQLQPTSFDTLPQLRGRANTEAAEA